MADIKISALALLAAASITATDRMVLVDDISGTPTTYQATLADVRTKLFAGGGAFAADPLNAAATTVTTLTATGALTYGGVTLANAVTGTGNMVLSASPTFTGTVLAAAATFSGVVTHSSTTTLSAALTYGGVTLSNAVTGTGNMVLSASPTFTGTVLAAALTASGLITASAGISATTGTFSDHVQIAATKALRLGGATASFPALYRSATAVFVRLADDSAYADLSAAHIVASNGLSSDTSVTAATTISTALGSAWDLGAAAAVSPTSPNRTVRIKIGGTDYYLAAKTTND